MAPKKNQKMSLGTFLQDENYGSWADEMEDMPLPSSDSRPSYGSDRRNFSSNAPSGDRFSERRDAYPPREQLPLPTQPPYTAHIANLSFDATQGDVNDFFRECQVTNVRIVEDRLDHKPKGFGYVEFGTLEGLKSALALSGNTLAGRQVRVSVAEPPKERQDARDLSDWSRKGPLPDLPQNQRRASDRPNFAGKNFDNVSDAGSERPNRRGFEQGDGKNRDFSNWERKGPLSPVTPAPTSLREGGRQHSKDAQGGFRKNSPAWGEGRSQDGGSRPPRREYTEKPVVERQPTASEMDNQWRARMRPDAPPKAPTPEASEPSSPAPPTAPALAVRPKLNLQKRTVSEAEPLSSPAATDSKASPFGAARPVDTAAKEKEVEEKRQLALRQRKEAEEKSRAEKAEEKRLAKEKTDAEKAKDPASKDAKDPSSTEDNEEENTQPTPKFDVLRRAEDNDMVAQEANDDEGEATPPVDEKAVKPKEVVRNPGNSRANGSWRGGPQSPAAAPDNSTAAALEEDGWSTVSKPTKQRNNRRNMPSRALAS